VRFRAENVFFQLHPVATESYMSLIVYISLEKKRDVGKDAKITSCI